MFTKRNINVFFILLAGFLFFTFQSDSYAASCNEIVGVWKWDNWDFTTFNSDGSIESDFADGQAGTWECENALLGIVKLKWDIDAFNAVAIYKNFSKIRSVQLSNDGSSLTVEPVSNNNVIKSAEKIFTVTDPPEPENKNVDKYADVVPTPAPNLPYWDEEISVGTCPGGNCSPMDQKNLDMAANPASNYQNKQDGSSHWTLTLLTTIKSAFVSLFDSIKNNDLRGTFYSLLGLAVCILFIVFIVNIIRG